ncbi:hypothetical protein FBU30_007888 [Linnemannia zychae]|nr:hypothetical protein FBU30_007888 [Linnemannia zychae]
MDFSGNQAASDMSSADLFEYLLSTDNVASFLSGTPTLSTSSIPSANQTAPSAVTQTTTASSLPVKSFSYRQISPNLPPSNPAPVPIAPAPKIIAPSIASSRSVSHVKPILPKAAPSTVSCTATATAVTTTAESLIFPSSKHFRTPATATTTSEDIWKERFQQLQQIQQIHRQKQHQLLSAAILNSPISTKSSVPAMSSSNRASKSSTSSQRDSSSERSVSPEKTERLRTIYPSPPMNDDMAMESDSESRLGSRSEYGKLSESQLKLMTSKERRQLRNKLSARNFRVRRKEYIDHLESQVKEAKQEVADIQRRLIQSELNCQFLRQELEATRLSQSLFGSDGGHMSKEHANLLASLLNPNMETFPVVNTNTNRDENVPTAITGTIQLPQEALPTSTWADTSLTDIKDINSSSEALPPTTTQAADDALMPIQPFMPFDGDWTGLLINRAEVSEPMVDPKDVLSGSATGSGPERNSAHDLLARYEALRRETEVDAQMRAEIKEETDRRLAQIYMVVPKEDNYTSAKIKSQLEEESVVLRSLIHMLMLQLTESLFEAANLSKTDLIRMYQAMDEPLRAKMLQQSKENSPNKFTEWRESWIKRYWPSYYNNRRRIVELIERSGICDPCYRTRDLKYLEIVEMARLVEEAVQDKTVDVYKPNFFYKTFVPNRFKCSGVLNYEKIEAEAKARAAAKLQQQQYQKQEKSASATSMPVVAAEVACA